MDSQIVGFLWDSFQNQPKGGFPKILTNRTLALGSVYGSKQKQWSSLKSCGPNVGLETLDASEVRVQIVRSQQEMRG